MKNMVHQTPDAADLQSKGEKTLFFVTDKEPE
jgi:hypothetical protein